MVFLWFSYDNPILNHHFCAGCQVGIPTEAGLPHAFGNAFRNVAALVADIDFTFKEAGGRRERGAWDLLSL